MYMYSITFDLPASQLQMYSCTSLCGQAMHLYWPYPRYSISYDKTLNRTSPIYGITSALSWNCCKKPKWLQILFNQSEQSERVQMNTWFLNAQGKLNWDCNSEQIDTRLIDIDNIRDNIDSSHSDNKPLFQWLSLLHSVCVESGLVHFLLLSLARLAGVVLGQVICELLVWRLGESSLLPQVRGQVRIGVGNGSICCLCCKTRYYSSP